MDKRLVKSLSLIGVLIVFLSLTSELSKQQDRTLSTTKSLEIFGVTCASLLVTFPLLKLYKYGERITGWFLGTEAVIRPDGIGRIAYLANQASMLRHYTDTRRMLKMIRMYFPMNKLFIWLGVYGIAPYINTHSVNDSSKQHRISMLFLYLGIPVYVFFGSLIKCYWQFRMSANIAHNVANQFASPSSQKGDDSGFIANYLAQDHTLSLCLDMIATFSVATSILFASFVVDKLGARNSDYLSALIVSVLSSLGFIFGVYIHRCLPCCHTKHQQEVNREELVPVLSAVFARLQTFIQQNQSIIGEVVTYDSVGSEPDQERPNV